MPKAKTTTMFSWVGTDVHLSLLLSKVFLVLVIIVGVAVGAGISP